MYTKAINSIIMGSVWIFGFLFYIAYFWIEDSIPVFKVFKVGSVFTGSFYTYFLIFLIVGTAVIIDVLHITLLREFDTPIYLLFKSLIRKKDINDSEKEKLFRIIVQKYKNQLQLSFN